MKIQDVMMESMSNLPRHLRWGNRLGLICADAAYSGGMEVRFKKPEGHVWGEEAAGAWGWRGGEVVDEMR